MCCCDVTSCCCGCNNLQKGTFIWALVDAIFNFIFFIATAAPLGGMSPTWICFFMIFWDVMLALGAHFKKPVLLIFWQIFMMLYIILLFCMWIAIPVILVGTIFVAAAVADSSSSTSSFTSSNVQLDAYSNTVNSAASATSAVAGAVAIVTLVFSIALPIIYIYFWIVVNNLRKELTRPAPQMPLQAYPQPMYNY